MTEASIHKCTPSSFTSMYHSSDHVAQRTGVLHLLFKTSDIIFLIEKNKCIIQHFNVFSTINEAHRINKKTFQTTPHCHYQIQCCQACSGDTLSLVTLTQVSAHVFPRALMSDSLNTQAFVVPLIPPHWNTAK